MTIGQRLRRAIERAGLTQREVAARSAIQQATISDILTDRVQPRFATVEKIVEAIGTTFGELFDEPRIQLSPRDVELLSRVMEFHERLLANDARQKEVRGNGAAERGHDADELVNLPNQQIPEHALRAGARRAFRVTTDAMIGDGLLEGAIAYVRPSTDVSAADGMIIACRLNGALNVKRLDLRGGKVTLENANPRYAPINVTGSDEFTLVGVVIDAR